MTIIWLLCFSEQLLDHYWPIHATSGWFLLADTMWHNENQSALTFHERGVGGVTRDGWTASCYQSQGWFMKNSTGTKGTLPSVTDCVFTITNQNSSRGGHRVPVFNRPSVVIFILLSYLIGYISNYIRLWEKCQFLFPILNSSFNERLTLYYGL